MLNKNISTNAKAFYVYLCARSGNKGICNQSIETICNDLDIVKTTFQKLKNELIEKNVIKVEKQGIDLQKRNYYKLLYTNNKGYGIVYLDVFKNKKLSLKAKVIYGFLAMYTKNTVPAHPFTNFIYFYIKYKS